MGNAVEIKIETNADAAAKRVQNLRKEIEAVQK